MNSWFNYFNLTQVVGTIFDQKKNMQMLPWKEYTLQHN